MNPPSRVVTFFRASVICVAFGLPLGVASADPDVRLPPGTRKTADGELISGRGLRDSTEFLAAELARRGIIVRQIGPYRVRGVELTRFVSDTAKTEWLAIHVTRIAGKTAISFVLRPKALDATPAAR